MALQPDMDRLYDQLVEEEDTRVCKDIPEDACSNVPANFFRQVAAVVMTSLGDTLTNPKTTLAWLLGVVGAPTAMVAWLVPLRDSGSMLPQMFIAAYVRRQALRKPLWVAGSLIQAAALVAMGAAARIDALTRFGFEAWSARAVNTYASILEHHRRDRSGAPAS